MSFQFHYMILRDVYSSCCVSRASRIKYVFKTWETNIVDLNYPHISSAVWKSSTLRKWLLHYYYLIWYEYRPHNYVSNDIFGFAVSPGLTKILPIEKCILFFDTLYMYVYHKTICPCYASIAVATVYSCVSYSMNLLKIKYIYYVNIIKHCVLNIIEVSSQLNDN